MPKVSILIPAYNQPDSLKRALDSIAEQTYTDYDVIITDDTRDDRNYNVAKLYLDLPLTYRQNKRWFGSPANWNECMRLANGEYIKFLHHDDWFAWDDALEDFVAALDDNPQSDFAFSSCWATSTSTRRLHSVNEEQMSDLKRSPLALLKSNLIGDPSTTIFRKSTGLTFDTNMKWLVDIDFYIRQLRKNPDFVFIHCPQVNITIDDPRSVTAECTSGIRTRLYEWAYIRSKILTGRM